MKNEACFFECVQLEGVVGMSPKPDKTLCCKSSTSCEFKKCKFNLKKTPKAKLKEIHEHLSIASHGLKYNYTSSSASFQH